jgi:hypothetical protein
LPFKKIKNIYKNKQSWNNITKNDGK